MSTSTFPLPNGVGVIPAIGLGTYLSKRHEVEKAVEFAIREGYRHLDLALVYNNQEEVGAALQKVVPSAVKREELFITTKLWGNSHHFNDVEKELDLSLQQLGLDYLDLYLIHWPVAITTKKGPEIDTSVTVAETWLAMYALMKTGKIRNIGVSNFTAEHLKQLIAATGIKPAVNQVELHPYLPQDDLLAYCKQEGIHVTGYYPLGGKVTKRRPAVIEHATVKEVAKNYPGATPAQVLLGWALARGYSVVPKSVTPERITSNLREVKISPEDVAKITKISEGNANRFTVPATAFGWKVDLFGTPEEQKITTNKALISNHKARL